MNNVWIDIKYANLLSGRLQQFKVKKNNPYLANFRCPLCGDSEKNKLKARGYIYQKDTKILFKCHNCGTTSSFSFFLKKIFLLAHRSLVKRALFFLKNHYLILVYLI